MFIKLVKAALKEGVITDDECKMLETVDKFYGHYDREFRDAVSDGFITQVECRKLHMLRNTIYEKAYVQAIKDGVVTEDELTILNKIQEAADLSDGEIKAIEEKVEKGEGVKLDKK